MADTKIEYADKTWEVSGGCTKCSPGCQNCWAIKEVWRMAHNPKLGKKWQGLVEKKNGILNWTGKIKCFEDALDKLRKKPTTYFIDSKSDLFHKGVPFEFIDKVLMKGWDYPQHTFLLLTKRIDRAAEYFSDSMFSKPQPNVHLGVSISTQAEADEKIPILLQIPAAVRGLSLEPLLSKIDLHHIKDRMLATTAGDTIITFDSLSKKGGIAFKDGVGIDWVIVGGESGPEARPMQPDWVRNIRDQCVAANVPFYFKQWGEWIDHSLTDIRPTIKNAKIVFLDGSTWPWSILSGRKYDIAVKKGGRTVVRVGKKKAGHLLDGKEWRESRKAVRETYV